MRRAAIIEQLQAGATLRVMTTPWGSEIPQALLRPSDPHQAAIILPMWQIERLLKQGDVVRFGHDLIPSLTPTVASAS